MFFYMFFKEIYIFFRKKAMLWVIEISKIFEKKTENTNKTEKIYKNVRIILRLHAKQDKIYCIQENNRGYIMEKIYETAYAKINLGLDVLGKRSDGYHEVRMVMQSVGLSDAVEIEEGEGLVPAVLIIWHGRQRSF